MNKRGKKLKSRDRLTRKMTKDGLVERNVVSGEETRISKREADLDLRGDLKKDIARRETLSQLGTRSGKKPKRVKQVNPPSPDIQIRAEPESVNKDIEPRQDVAPEIPYYHKSSLSEKVDSAGFTQDSPPSEMPAQTVSSDFSERAEEPERSNAGPVDKPAVKLKPNKPDKLKFTADETAPETPKLKAERKLAKAQRQADRAESKLEKAKLPSKKKIRSKRVFDEQSGKSKRKLYFEREVKSQSEHIRGALPLRPVKAAGNAAIAYGHRKLNQTEQENTAVEAAHKIETTAEGAVRSALRYHKTAPYRKVERLKRKSKRKSINLSYRKAVADNPKLQSNALARFAQKRKIKKDYAKAAREVQKAAQRAKKVGSAVGNAAKAVAGVIKRHPVAAITVIMVILFVFAIMSLLGMFSGIGSGGLGGILSASYLAEDADIDNAELVYTEWETDLQMKIANTENSRPGYDEYRYNIGEISHNPFELMAYLTAKYQNFTYDAIAPELAALFGEQYTLTVTPDVEVRYADPYDADNDGDFEPYDRTVLTVRLTSKSFTDIVTARMDGDETERYGILMQSKGSRQYIANPLGFEWLSRVTDFYGWRINPASGDKSIHYGVDIAVPAGTEIHAGQDGVVTTAAYDAGGYGYYVVIEDDKTGNNGSVLVSKYAYCGELLVTAGQSVKTGEVIAKSGSSGNAASPRLHLEVIKNGRYLNPLYFADTGSISFIPAYGNASPMGDGTYAALLAEAEKYLGYPYVWGGSVPATSFDCSGYVSWVLTHSGVKNVGRLGATSLFNICIPVAPGDAQPGDLVFFQGTYSTVFPVTHVGIYVGVINGVPTMLHCGNPIQYTRIDTAYWQNHFYSYGRIT
ncbi:MAG: peptidoglycan DD-metalloendopeptidase family protein [Oscillospiraceae bacterium]|jgi:murein DD-endopeptidase MepM/ murein hydrolase activator NlpD|nr:peptidoglycan DD-metalloendopeptidase family protein [Oscillospiraceae bacterium]